MGYDKDYLDSDCTVEYDPDTKFDGSAWTYATNYLILGVGLIISIILLNNKGLKTSKGLMPLFFAMSSIGYGIAGFLHQYIELTSDPLYQPLWNTIFAFEAIGALALFVLALSNIFPGNKYLFVAIIILGCVMVVVGSIVNWISFVALGLIGGAWLSLFFVYIKEIKNNETESKFWNICKIGAGIIYFVGTAVQFFLGMTCGVGGYEECFVECSAFADPGFGFNHNAVFHILVALSFLIQGIAEYNLPTCFLKKEPDNEEHEIVVVESEYDTI